METGGCPPSETEASGRRCVGAVRQLTAALQPKREILAPSLPPPPVNTGRYEGEFEDNQMSGYGVYVWGQEGSVYRGQVGPQLQGA